MPARPPADPGLRLRAARLDEIDAVRAIERASSVRMLSTPFPELADDEPADPGLLAARIAAGGLTVACAQADTPVAFVMHRPLVQDWYIEQIDVLPDWGRRGIGAGLLAEVARQGRAAGARALVLSTFREVAFNAPYYRRLGFAELGEDELDAELRAIREAHLARGLDETRRVFMRSRLRP
ncbi:MAG: GNAT family N-acetyltransferase [Phenylobacterium sp.]|uniref:GNAT family N-acetyltransferase n=1 Tax=Phenylobacterium sp. TaxID=1871053 RepID=UPI00391B0007